MATFDVRVHAKIDGSTWTDISDDVMYGNRVNIRVGAGNQGGRVDTGSCTFRLRNDSGDWTPGNPMGAHYPDWGRGTQVRASVYEGDVALLMEGSSGGASTPDNAALDITGDLDVRLELSLWNFSDVNTGGTVRATELIAKLEALTNKSWMLVISDGSLMLEWSTTGSDTVQATATTPLRVPGSNPRMAIRATLDVNNGAGGHTVTFYRADSLDSETWEVIGEPVVGSGVTSIFNSTASLVVGNATNFAFNPLPAGSFHRAEVRNGIGGTVVANPDFTAQASGTTSFADAAGRTWTVSSPAEITNRKTRFVGEIASLSPGRTQKNFKFVDIEAAGLMRRLEANDEKLKSAVYRDITSPNRENIIAYWPMEDGEDSDSFSTPLTGSNPAIKSPSGVELAAYTEWGASSPIPTFTTGYMLADMPDYAATGETAIRFFLAVAAGGVAADRVILRIPTTGTARLWLLEITSGGAVRVRVQNSVGTEIHNSGPSAFALNGVRRVITFDFEETGGDVVYRLISNGVGGGDDTAGAILTNTVAGVTFGRINSIKMSDGGDLAGTAMGQLSVGDSLDAYSGSSESTRNWFAESATDRSARLCLEEDIAIDFTGTSAIPQDGQSESDLLTILRGVAATEQALLGETRYRVGLLYRTHDSLSSQDPVFSLSYSGGEAVAPFQPVYDDDQLVNDFTASRENGGFSRYRETEGRLSVSDPPSGVGPYEGSDSFGVAYEWQTGDLAGWPVHLGTFEGARFSGLLVRLDKNRALVDDLCRAYVGDVAEVSGVPLDLAGTSDIKLRIEGYKETIDQFEWEIDFVMSPGEPWDTGFAGHDDTAWDTEQFAWADTETSELAEALTTTETDVDILTTAGPRWTSDPFDSPYLLRVGGEIIRVQAPGGLINDNPFFGSNITGWEAVGATLAHETSIVVPYPDAAGSLKITPDGVTAVVGARSAHTAAGTVNPGGVYTASGWMFSATASSDVRFVVDWYDSADVFLSSSTGSASSLAASEWTFLQQDLTAPASASRAAVRAYRGGTPAAGAVTYCWAVRITRSKASTVHDGFGRTATDTWGSADSSQAWTNTGGAAADYDVLSGYGRHTHPSAAVGHHSVTAAPNADFDIYCDIAVAATSTGASQFGGIIARYADVDNLYEARLDFTTTGSVNLTLRERVAAVESALATATAAATYSAGTFLRCRFQGYGTALKAKVWALTEEEPHAWDVQATDSSLTSAGSLGVKSMRNTGNTNASADIRFDTFDLITPQTFVVERSVNTVVKTHSSGADIRLAFPAVPGI